MRYSNNSHISLPCGQPVLTSRRPEPRHRHACAKSRSASDGRTPLRHSVHQSMRLFSIASPPLIKCPHRVDSIRSVQATPLLPPYSCCTTGSLTPLPRRVMSQFSISALWSLSYRMAQREAEFGGGGCEKARAVTCCRFRSATPEYASTGYARLCSQFLSFQTRGWTM